MAYGPYTRISPDIPRTYKVFSILKHGLAVLGFTESEEEQLGPRFMISAVPPNIPLEEIVTPLQETLILRPWHHLSVYHPATILLGGIIYRCGPLQISLLWMLLYIAGSLSSIEECRATTRDLTLATILYVRTAGASDMINIIRLWRTWSRTLWDYWGPGQRHNAACLDWCYGIRPNGAWDTSILQTDNLLDLPFVAVQACAWDTLFQQNPVAAMCLKTLSLREHGEELHERQSGEKIQFRIAKATRSITFASSDTADSQRLDTLLGPFVTMETQDAVFRTLATIYELEGEPPSVKPYREMLSATLHVKDAKHALSQMDCLVVNDTLMDKSMEPYYTEGYNGKTIKRLSPGMLGRTVLANAREVLLSRRFREGIVPHKEQDILERPPAQPTDTTETSEEDSSSDPPSPRTKRDAETETAKTALDEHTASPGQDSVPEVADPHSQTGITQDAQPPPRRDAQKTAKRI